MGVLAPLVPLWEKFTGTRILLHHSSEDVLFSNWEDHTHYGGNMKRRRQKLINIHTAKMTRQLLFGAHLTTKTWCHTFNLKESPWCPSPVGQHSPISLVCGPWAARRQPNVASSKNKTSRQHLWGAKASTKVSSVLNDPYSFFLKGGMTRGPETRVESK